MQKMQQCITKALEVKHKANRHHFFVFTIEQAETWHRVKMG